MDNFMYKIYVEYVLTLMRIRRWWYKHVKKD